MKEFSRRDFIRTGATIAIASAGSKLMAVADISGLAAKPVYGHLWVYASKYPPDWDCSPALETVFSDFRYAGIQGVELMEVLLRPSDSVARMQDLASAYNVPVTGCSYYGDMWNRNEHGRIEDDVETILQRLHALRGRTFGITVGDAGRRKTEMELDDQARILQKILGVCKTLGIRPNLHNHTFELAHEMHDLSGTLARVPDLMLGPDINWLIRGGVDPVTFIRRYGKRMIYLHLRDQYKNNRWTDSLGEGVTDFRAISMALQDVGYDGEVAIELALDDEPRRPVRESWKMSRAYVREVFGW